MHSCEAWIETENASKYLQQLCKHFAHKVNVEYDDKSGKAALPPGPCVMQATEKKLHITCHSEEKNALETSRSIVDIHLKKFAWREELDINWQDCPNC